MSTKGASTPGSEPPATETTDRSRRQLLTGWGGAPASCCNVIRPTSLDGDENWWAAVAGQLNRYGGRGAIARGLGRSYGDAAQLAGGTAIDMTGRGRILEIDAVKGSARVEGGANLEQLMVAALAVGRFVPVTPGTRQVTVGGAIAADIHGKNHHVDGSFGSHVSELRLGTPEGTLELRPGRDQEMFWATVGGMGLTGVVLEATIDLPAVETAYMEVDTERAADLDDVMARMEASDHEYRYSVAWIDCLARGASLGRSVLTRGDHATAEQLPQKRLRSPLRFDPAVKLEAPGRVPSGLLNRFSVAAFNEAWFRKAPRHEVGRLMPLGSFFHPLDGVGGWNRLYGARGFLQYQFVVPFGAEETLREAIGRLSASGQASFLAVLKRFGEASPGPLSFPSPGWTLALDLPIGNTRMAELLDGLDDLITEAGGRIYLAKDSRMRPEVLDVQYPAIGAWRETRDTLDPNGLMCSDLCRRLDLSGRHGRRRRTLQPHRSSGREAS